MSAANEPFFQGCERGELLLRHCRACDETHFHPRVVCIHCGSRDLDWSRASGDATLVSYSVVRRAIQPQFKDRVPYVVAIVRLDEGPQMMSQVLDCDPDALKIGAPLRLGFDSLGGDRPLPVFRVAES